MFISLAVDAASGNLSVKQLVAALGDLDVASVGSVGVLGKVADTLWGLAKAATGTATEMNALNEITGADPKIVQQWEKAAERIQISAGSITRSISAVHRMNAGIAAGGGPPSALTGILGLNPYKGTDAQGRPIYNEFLDYMAQMRTPGSAYSKLSPALQLSALSNAFPGADSEAMFRILKAKDWHPERISVLENKQVAELTAVKRKETEIGQQLVGIFDKLLTGGGAFADVLDSITKKLDSIDKWLGGKQGQEAIATAGTIISKGIGGGDLLGALKERIGEKMFRGIGSILSEGLRPAAVSPMGSTLSSKDDYIGRLTIDFKREGQLLGSKQTFVGKGITNGDTWDLTDQIGNGGQGQ